ncbi:hypothetical protein [Gordonia sp. NPDC003376]
MRISRSSFGRADFLLADGAGSPSFLDVEEIVELIGEPVSGDFVVLNVEPREDRLVELTADVVGSCRIERSRVGEQFEAGPDEADGQDAGGDGLERHRPWLAYDFNHGC